MFNRSNQYKKKINLLHLFNWVFVLIFALCIIGYTDAQLIFEPDNKADIKLSCFDVNSNFCSSATYCNITILYPNMTTLVSNALMTNNINYLNYTTAINLTERGDYHAVVKCDQGVTSGYSSFSFLVSNVKDRGQGIVSVGILFSVIAIAFIFMILGFKFSQYPKLYPFTLFFILVTFVIAIYGLHLGYLYNRDMLLSTAFTSNFSVFYTAIFYGLLGMGLFGLTFLTIKVVMNLQSAIEQKKMGEFYNQRTKEYDDEEER